MTIHISWHAIWMTLGVAGIFFSGFCAGILFANIGINRAIGKGLNW